MLLALEFPSEGKSLHNKTEALKEEIRKGWGGGNVLLYTDSAECVGMCVYDERTEAGFSQD